MDLDGSFSYGHIISVRTADGKVVRVKYQIHPTQIAAWKREFLEKAELVFSKEAPAAKEPGRRAEENLKEKELYSKIGELQVQVDYLNSKRQRKPVQGSQGLR